MTRRKKVIFLTNTMTAGGAERVMSNMANYLSIEKSNDFEILLLTTAVTEDFYEISNQVRREYLDKAQTKTPLILKPFKFILRWWRLKRLINVEKPDCVVSFLENVNLLNTLGCLGTSTNSIISMRNDPRKNNIGPLLSAMRRLVYPLADKLVVQTNSVLEWCKARSLNSRTIVVPNSVKIPEVSWVQNTEANTPFKFIAAGRLVPQKGFDLLIEAASLIKSRDVSMSIDIYGKGSLAHELQQKIEALNLEKAVHLKGLTENLQDKLLEADAFVLSSRYEGFPNVLLEALALGVPSVSFDCKSGPSDIIDHGVDGLLVDDGSVEALAEAMEKVIKDRSLSLRMGDNAKKNMLRYEISSIMTMWCSIF
ncbi:MAG: glycosyltransferase family 4 protein [Bdellovibrionota bacterium]|nr:glycosyltransferase family 4 protein [Bdellovibrionota bacterium]